MRIQCDVCERNVASVMCCADEAALCTECDSRIHATNKLSEKHVRVPLLKMEAPNCDICQEKRAFFFCIEDRALLCRNCDVSIHTVNTLSCNHKRFLVTGTRVALDAIRDDPVEPVTSEFQSPLPSSRSGSVSTASSPTSTLQGPCNSIQSVCHKTETLYSSPTISACTPCYSTFSGKVQGISEAKRCQDFQTPKTNQGLPVDQPISLPSMGVGLQSAGLMRKSSISEFLTNSVPGWRVDDLLSLPDYGEGFDLTDITSTKADGVSLGGDYDWTAGLSIFEEKMFTMHEVPQFPPSPVPAAPLRSIRAPKLVRGKGKQDILLTTGFDDTFIVPNIRVSSAPASQPLRKRKQEFYGI